MPRTFYKTLGGWCLKVIGTFAVGWALVKLFSDLCPIFLIKMDGRNKFEWISGRAYKT